MGYSNDLRVRVIRVVEGGAAARAAARQFVIGDATAIRWAKRWRETGSFEAKSNKGQSRSPLKKHEEWLLELVRQEPDLDVPVVGLQGRVELLGHDDIEITAVGTTSERARSSICIV